MSTTPAPATGTARPAYSFNLTSIRDWSPVSPFIDLMKISRPLYAKGWSNEQLKTGGYLDENGYLTRMPPGVEKVQTLWHWDANGPRGVVDGHKGRYVLEWDGDRPLVVQGHVKIVSSEAGRIVFDNPTGGYMSVQITGATPDNYAHNITLVRAEHEEIHKAGAIFTPEWVDVVDDAGTLRFMDWGNTNNCTVKTWADRAHVDTLSYAGEAGGVPIELMIKLCNQTGTDLWVNIPHMADDDYVRNIAQLVRDNLDPGLEARFEYSNETWNSMFTQMKYATAMAQKEFGTSAYYSWSSYRATQVAQILKAEFANVPDADAPELVNVLGMQTAWLGLSNMIASGEGWQDRVAAGQIAATWDVFDELGVTSYFGVRGASLRNEFVSKIKAGWTQSQLNDWLLRACTSRSDSGTVAQLEIFKFYKSLADSHGLTLNSYEGGQHVHHADWLRGLSGSMATKVSKALANFVRSSEMADLYRQSAKNWAHVSDEPYMQFGEIGGATKFGSWGILGWIGDNSPRYNALVRDIPRIITGTDSDPVHQDGDYLNGSSLAELAVGTRDDDLISGRGGNDTIVAGGGDDTIAGGTGTDTVVLTGNSTDYTATVKNGAVLLRGNGDELQLYGVEKVAFADGEMATLKLSAPNAGLATAKAALDPDAPRALTGTATSELLSGAAGNDTLTAAGGNDTLTGNAGADEFRFVAVASHHVVTDYDAAEGDVIVLTGAAAGAVTSTNATPEGLLVEIGDAMDILLVGVRDADDVVYRHEGQLLLTL